MNCVWYCNPHFDLTLAGPVPPRLQPFVDETSLWFIPAAGADDCVITKLKPPPEWTEYLGRCGLNVPLCVDRVAKNTRIEPMPWGWNREAFKLFAQNAPNTLEYETARRVNGRAFSYELAGEHGLDLAESRLCTTVDETLRALAEGNASKQVVKPEFGSSGIGFLHVGAQSDPAQVRRGCEMIFSGGNSCAIVEPWLNRCGDCSVRFTVESSGTCNSPVVYRTMATSSGAFYATLLFPGDSDSFLDPWRNQLCSVAEIAAASLARAGYCGPATVDSMVIRDSRGNKTLIPLVEINARYSMSRLADRVRNILAPDRTCLFRTIATGRIQLPGDYRALAGLLGPCAWDTKHRTGVAVLTPLRLSGKPPLRTMLFLAHCSETALVDLDKQLTDIITRRGNGGNP